MTLSPHLDTAITLAFSIGAVAYTISSSKISMPLRLAVARRAIVRKSKAWRWLSDLLSCPYCISHWLAFAATVVYRPWLVDSGISEAIAPTWFGRVFDFFVTSMAMVTLAMVPVWLIKRALAGTAENRPASPPESAGGNNAARLNELAQQRLARRGDDPNATTVDPGAMRRPSDPGAGATDRTQIM